MWEEFSAPVELVKHRTGAQKDQEDQTPTLTAGRPGLLQDSTDVCYVLIPSNRFSDALFCVLVPSGVFPTHTVSFFHHCINWPSTIIGSGKFCFQTALTCKQMHRPLYSRLGSGTLRSGVEPAKSY
jgi:hypothetical protein